MKHSTAIPPLQEPSASSDESTSIFVAAKSDFSVEGLLRILSDNSQNRIVACVEPSESCWDKLRNTRPDILLLHHKAVIAPKHEFFVRIKNTVPGIKILVFGQSMDDMFLIDIVRAGASGYINENMNGQDLLNAIQQVKKGQLWVEQRILETLAQGAINMDLMVENTILKRVNNVRNMLTKRETEIYKFVLEGFATKEIAGQVHLSEQSVKLHLGRIFKKFQVTNRSQLILSTFARICPVSNIFRLIRMMLDKRRIEKGQSPIIHDPLEENPFSLKI
ncbi:MAG: response regulator transcription factor [Sulfuricaulis sp.]